MDDAELFLKFKRGDKSTFCQLVEKYQYAVINTCYRFLRNRDEAEEAAQEVFLKVYLSANSYQPRAKFSTWLFKIVMNLCLNKLRDKKKYSSLKIDNPFYKNQIENDIPALTESQPDKSYEHKELKRIIKDAIDSLPENQRVAIMLNKYEGFSYQDMAKILDCSVSSIQSRLFRAKESLKKKLEPYIKKDAI